MTVLIVPIAICVVIEAVLTLADHGLLNWPRLRSLAYEYGAFWPGLLRDWRPNFPAQPWTMFITYGFLHAGLVHLGFNMVTLWSLGRVVVDRAGRAGFLWIYGITMIVGAAVYGAITVSGRPMVGASGALFGLAGAIVAWAWVARPNTRASLRATWRALAFLLAINVVMYLAFAGRLAWQTHLGGFVAGWLLGIVIERRQRR